MPRPTFETVKPSLSEVFLSLDDKSDSELAYDIGVTPEIIKNIKSWTYEPDMYTMIRIVNYLESLGSTSNIIRSHINAANYPMPYDEISDTLDNYQFKTVDSLDDLNIRTKTMQVTATRKRVQTNASWRWGDAIEIKITDYPKPIRMILTKMDSQWTDWKVYQSFWDDENIKDFSFRLTSIILWLEPKHETVYVIILDKDNIWKQFSF